ncbi:MAG: hypothetical protein ABW252_04575 [Polyangiales bacterium]
MRKSFLVVPAALLLAIACGVDDGDADVASSDPRAQVAASPIDAATPSVAAPDAATPDAANFVAWKTDEFELAAGKERYLCFTKTLEEDLVIDGYQTAGLPYVHHLIFSRNRQPGKPGFEECTESFRMAWDPVFITGAGAAKLEFPKDAGHKLPKGTQLVVQMHLLNTSEEAVKGALEIDMHRSSVANPRPVNSYIFGSPEINLPPNAVSKVTGDCTMREKLDIIAGFPHMHMLGTAMTFETGTSKTELKTQFKRDPFSFDSQSIEPMNLTLSPGDVTRTTCTYKNTHNQVVKYGESSMSEMCYFIAFAVDRQAQSACLSSLPPLTGLR